jgi:sulfur-oxidizing protein SoxY
LVSLGLVTETSAVAAGDRAGFDQDSLEGALKAIGGRPATSAQVVLSALDITEDGAATPVGVVSLLPGTTEIHVLVEKNPIPLSASFKILPGTLPDVRLRIKMAESSPVLAVVRAEGRLYVARKHTSVTLGSCGG